MITLLILSQWNWLPIYISGVTRRRVDMRFGIGYEDDIDKEGLSIPYPQQDIHVYSETPIAAPVAAVLPSSTGVLKYLAVGIIP